MRIELIFADEVRDKQAKFLLVENELSTNELVAKGQIERLGESLKAEGCAIQSVSKTKDACIVYVHKAASNNVIL